MQSQKSRPPSLDHVLLQHGPAMHTQDAYYCRCGNLDMLFEYTNSSFETPAQKFTFVPQGIKFQERTFQDRKARDASSYSQSQGGETELVFISKQIGWKKEMKKHWIGSSKKDKDNSRKYIRAASPWSVCKSLLEC